MNISKPDAPLRMAILLAVLAVFAWCTYQGFRKLSADGDEAEQPLFKANRVIPHNWRLSADDLVQDPKLPVWSAAPSRSSLAGKYFIAERQLHRNDPVALSDLGARPVIPSRAGVSVALIPLEKQPELVKVLNAGSVVAVCAEDCVDRVPIEFIWCDSANSCFAAVTFSKEQRAAFKDLKESRIFLQGK